MPYHALISTTNSNNGSLSTIKRVFDESITATPHDLSLPQLEEAARVLAAYEDRAGYPTAMFNDRHWHIDACLVPFHPHKVQSGLKIFDDQCNRSGGFMTGNASTNTQTSQYVRPVNMTECNGMSFAPGELRKSDLRAFTESRDPHQPGRDSMLDELKRAENINKMLVVYKVFHTQAKPNDYGQPVRRVHGWVITEPCGKLVRAVIPEAFHTPTSRIMDRAIAEFSHETVGDRVRLLRIDGGSLTYVAPELAAFHESRKQRESVDASNGNNPASPSRKPF